MLLLLFFWAKICRDVRREELRELREFCALAQAQIEDLEDHVQRSAKRILVRVSRALGLNRRPLCHLDVHREQLGLKKNQIRNSLKRFPNSRLGAICTLKHCFASNFCFLCHAHLRLTSELEVYRVSPLCCSSNFILFSQNATCLFRRPPVHQVISGRGQTVEFVSQRAI